MTTIICPKCLETAYSRDQYCSQCGVEVIKVVFRCECGAEIYPLFTIRFFPPWGKSLISSRSHCPHCGRDVRNLVKEEVRRQWKGGAKHA